MLIPYFQFKKKNKFQLDLKSNAQVCWSQVVAYQRLKTIEKFTSPALTGGRGHQSEASTPVNEMGKFWCLKEVVTHTGMFDCTQFI